MGPDWTTAYDNRAAVPGAMALADRWSAAAAAFRARPGILVERLASGPGPRERVDLIRPDGAAAGLAVFVHGGYWMRNAPEMFTHLAAGALAAGWAVAMPGHALCPQVRIGVIVEQVRAGIAAAAGEVPGPIRIAGHSAGGHLAARMVATGGLAPGVVRRVAGVLAISGIHDLRPLLRTPMQPTLRLDLAQARADSPALLEPAGAAPLTAWVGARELPELRRQSALIANVWTGLGVETRLIEDEGHDHFSVIEGLGAPDSPIARAWVGA